MLESSTQGTNIQGGQNPSGVTTQIPQASRGGTLQQPSQRDILTDPSSSISVPQSGTREVQLAEVPVNSGVEADTLGTFMIIGAFTFAIMLIVLLVKIAKPAGQHEEADEDDAKTSATYEGVTNGQIVSKKPAKRSKKRTSRRQRKQS